LLFFPLEYNLRPNSWAERLTLGAARNPWVVVTTRNAERRAKIPAMIVGIDRISRYEWRRMSRESDRRDRVRREREESFERQVPTDVACS